jgi:glycosyltransferase involved in cell wall biosynthesis
MNQDKIGVGVITYNSEDYFKKLWHSIPRHLVQELVVVNGGDPYKGDYKGARWIQHTENKYPAVCRNEAVQHLLDTNCTHLFLIEDDMIIRTSGIFNAYIKASEISGLKYFSFASTSWESGTPERRTPQFTVSYPDGINVSLYKNMCNEFTYHHRSCFEKTGMYDTQFRDPFDIDMAYRESQQDYCAPFWYFADIANADVFIQNNPVAVSRLQAEGRPDGSREQRIQEQWNLFIKKHGLMVNQIPDIGAIEALNKLRSIAQPS